MKNKYGIIRTGVFAILLSLGSFQVMVADAKAQAVTLAKFNVCVASCSVGFPGVMTLDLLTQTVPGALPTVTNLSILPASTTLDQCVRSIRMNACPYTQTIAAPTGPVTYVCSRVVVNYLGVVGPTIACR